VSKALNLLSGTGGGRLVLVRLAQQQVRTGSIGPLRRGRVNFLEHGQRQPRAAGREMLPRS
jgi:hypothetical protein